MEVIPFLKELDRLNHSKAAKDILILGAGIAGLIAAYELRKRGHRVRIYEASDRVGGRILTKRFREDESLYGELGAMRIPKEHEAVLHYIHAMELSNKLRPFRSVFQNSSCYVDMLGKRYRMEDAVECFTPLFQFGEGRELKSPLTEPFVTALKIVIDAIAPGEIRSLFQKDLETGLIEYIDHLLTSETISIKKEMIQPVEVVPYLHHFTGKWNRALDLFIRDVILETSNTLFRLDGGMDQLPLALVKQLRDCIYLNHPVREIAILKQRIRVGFESGKSLTAPYVLCTIPFSVLRTLDLSGFSASKLHAVQTIGYAGASKVLFLCKEPFWEKSIGSVEGGASVSDQKIRQIYYPPSSGKQNKKAVLLAAYAIGTDSKALDNLIEVGKYKDLKRAVGRLHPEIEQAMVLEATGISWEQQPWVKGGCCVMWNSTMTEKAETVGYEEKQQLEDLFRHTVCPEGRLFFAGEHCSRKQAWLEGAVESALYQVKNIITCKG